MLLVVSKNNLINSILKAVNQAGFDVTHTCFSTLCAAQASLLPKEKKDGCLFINVGASATDILMYKDGILKNIHILDIGGDAFTQDIAEKLQLPFDLSEDIKRSYATVMSSEEVSATGEILVKRDKEYLPVERQDICSAIIPSSQKFIAEIQNILRTTEMIYGLNAGVVVSGGGALLSGLVEFIEKNLNLPTHIGKIRIETKRLSSPALYAAAIGLAQEAAQGNLRNLFSFSQEGSSAARFMVRVKEFYQEYF